LTCFRLNISPYSIVNVPFKHKNGLVINHQAACLAINHHLLLYVSNFLIFANSITPIIGFVKG